VKLYDFNREYVMTLTGLLERNAKEIPEKTAIVFHSEKISYRDLNISVNKVANALLDLGIKKADRVGFMLPRIPELLTVFFAAAKIGSIAVPVNFELLPEKIRAALNNFTPSVLFVHPQFLDAAKKSISIVEQIPMIVVGEGGTGPLRWDDIIRNGNAEAPGLEIKESDVVYLNYTSGATGNAKGAVTTHANIYWNTLSSVEALGLTGEDVHLCMFAPFAHPHEIFARPLYLGGTMVILDKIYPKSIAEAISTHKVSCMMGLAPMYENLLEALEHKNYDLSSLRVPESGGMYTRIELIDRFRERVGVPIVPVWGSTETTGVAIANRPDEPILPGSIGKSCSFYEVRIVDENGGEVLPGEVGEMIFKGPAVVEGYYEKGKESEMSFKDGWYYSGDLGKKDEQGNFYFVERISGMMKVAGLKVYPLEVELVLMAHPDIKEAVVVSAKDRLRGEIPRAIIVVNDGKSLSEKEILRFCKEYLAHYKHPRIIEIRDSIPKIGSGKINKKELLMEHT